MITVQLNNFTLLILFLRQKSLLDICSFFETGSEVLPQ